MLEALLPAYLAARRGHIAVVASVAGYRGLPTGAAYGATKAALVNLCEALKFDLDRAGVKLQLVNPGFVKTPLTDQNEFRMPALMPVEKAVARMIAGLESERFEITFPRRFTWQMKLLRLLPYPFYFAVTRRRTGA
jgi:short-subunit dehydrogenase